jgi:hypothetical protein
MTTTSTTAGHAQASESDLLSSKTSGFIIAYAWTAIFNAILVLLKENIEIVLKIMAGFGHHWVTHGVLDLIVFFGLGAYFAGRNTQLTGTRAVSYLIWSTLIGGGIIFAFFVGLYFS